MGEMRKYLGRLVGHWAVVVVMVVVGGALGLLYTQRTPPSYTASSVLVATADPSLGDRRDVNFAQAYARLVGQQGVAAAAGAVAALPVDEVMASVRAATSPDSPMIEISGSANGAQRAADLVNAAAKATVDVAATRLADTGVRLIVLSPALPPPSPSSPDLVVDVAVGAAAGFLLGGLFVLGRGARPAGLGPAYGGVRFDPYRQDLPDRLPGGEPGGYPAPPGKQLPGAPSRPGLDGHRARVTAPRS